MAKAAKPMPDEMGNTLLPITAGTYRATSITVASETIVYLQGSATDIFLFQSASTMVSGANTNFVLLMADGCSPVTGKKPNGAGGPITCTYDADNAPQAKNILFVVAAAATTGADSTVEGSILAGAAITLGAASEVTGILMAAAGATFGAASQVNSANIITSTTVSPVKSLVDDATCFQAPASFLKSNC
jgi:hypothetical protein